MATKKAPAAPAATLIHEVNSKFQHRIIEVANGVVTTGDWAEMHQLASFKGYLANMESASKLPMGIFRISRVANQSAGY